VLIVLRFGVCPSGLRDLHHRSDGQRAFLRRLLAWYMTTSIFALLSVVALAGWGSTTRWGGALVDRQNRLSCIALWGQR